MRIKRRLLVVVMTVFGAGGLLAEDYTVSVPEGETWDWSRVESVCGTATSGKRLVKEGLGILAPGADLSAKGFSDLVVNAGVYDATALNQFPAVNATATLTVVSGATLRYGFSMTQTTTTINITVGGEGAAGEQGAIVFTVNSPLGAKNGPNWILTADTVFYAKGSRREVDFSCNGYGPTDQHNLFYMNGHSLRFKAEEVGTHTESGPWFRFRSGPTFIQPGDIIFDHCRLSRYNGGGARVWKSATDRSAGTIPCIRLVNGACCNFACTDDKQWLSCVACIDAEAGTEIGDMGVSSSDMPGKFTINKLVGAPTILGAGSTQNHAYNQQAYIKSYVARGSDLADGKILTSVTNLYFSAGATISIDDGSLLTQGVEYNVASGAAAVIGSILSGDDLTNRGRKMEASADGNAVKLSWTAEYAPAADDFLVFVPAGLVYDWAQATNGLDVSGMSGKKLVKLGRGTLYRGDVGAAGCTELIVANGVYGAYDFTDLPILNTVMKVTVKDGATFKAVGDLQNLTAESHSLDLYLTGTGHRAAEGDLGAFCFWWPSIAGNQWCKWTFDGDTLITIADAADQANFSANSLARSDTWNVWNMNGHDLTLRCLNGKKGMFRFRSGPTIHNPGNITLDNARFSMYSGASMKVVDGMIPVFKTVNDCTVNFANANKDNIYLNKCVDVFDFGPGTVIDNVTFHPTDGPGPTTISNLVGSVTVSTAQVLTVVNTYTVRKADLMADPPQILVAEKGLTFEENCTLSVEDDDLTGLSLKTGVTIVKCPKGKLSGRPKPTGDFSVRFQTEGDFDCLKLWSRGGVVVIFR